MTNRPLSYNHLKNVRPNAIFKSGVEMFEHPWQRGDKILMKWVAVRGQIPDWAIYTSFDSNICEDLESGCLCHVNASNERVARLGAKLHDMDVVQKLVPSDAEALQFYRH